MDARLDDHLRVGFRGLARKLERIAHEVGHAMEDLGRHVIVGEDHRIAAFLQRVDRVHIWLMHSPFHCGDDMRDLPVKAGSGCAGGRRLNGSHPLFS